MDRDQKTSFIRENTPLLIGFSIPLLIFCAVMLFQSISRSIIHDPAYSAVFVADYDAFNRYKPYTVLVEHGKLVIEKNLPEPDSERVPDYSKKPSIYYFDHKTKQTRRLDIDFDNVAPNNYIVSPELSAINRRPLLTERLSPDGYMFSYRSGKADAMVAGLFNSSFQHQGYAIYKGGKIINITHNGKRIADPQFLAWIDEDSAP